jgi:hypothetical protein
MRPRGARAHSSLHTRCERTVRYTRRARTRTQTDQEARTDTHAHAHTHTRIGRHAGAHDCMNQHAHSSCREVNTHTVLAERHARHACNCIGGCMHMCCDGGRAARANGPKCVRGWVGLVRTPWVSLDYPSSTLARVPTRVPPSSTTDHPPLPSRAAHLRRCSPTRR